MSRGYCVLISILVVTILICSCKTSPELIKAREAIKSDNIEEVHKYYRGAIENSQDKEAAYCEYSLWLLDYFDILIKDVDNSAAALPGQVAYAVHLRNGYMTILDQIAEAEKFLAVNYEADVQSKKSAMFGFRHKVKEQRQFLNYHIDSFEKRIIELRKKSKKEEAKGESAYRMGNFDKAEEFFQSALAADSQNKRAAMLSQNINDYEYGRSLYLRKSISSSKQLFEDLINRNSADTVITGYARRELVIIRGMYSKAQNLKTKGLGQIKGKRFGSAVKYLKLAMEIDHDLEMDLTSTIKASEQFELAFKNMKKKKYETAINFCKEGLELCPGCNFAKSWLENAETLYKRSQVDIKLKLAEKAFGVLNVQEGKQLVESALALSTNKSETSKKIARITQKAGEEYIKLYKKSLKNKDLSEQWKYISGCISVHRSGVCDKAKQKFIDDNLPAIISKARNVSDGQHWPEALIASGAALQLNPENKEILSTYELSSEKNLESSAIVFELINESGSSTENHDLTQTVDELEKLFNENHLNWRWSSEGDSSVTTGRHFTIVFSVGSVSGDNNVKDGQIVENKQENKKIATLKDGFLLDIRDAENNSVASLWCKNGQFDTESLKNLVSSCINSILNNSKDSQDDPEKIVLGKYMFKPPVATNNWLEIYLALLEKK